MAINNPRTREGCDGLLVLRRGQPQSFNPRTREGCDERSKGRKHLHKLVSIHAPARGATPHQ